MRIVELSNHPAGLLAAEASARQRKHECRQARHRGALAEHAEQVRQLREQADRARRSGAPLAWLAVQLALWRLRRRRPLRPAPPWGGVAASTHTRRQIAAGLQGEQLLAGQLADALDEQWTMFRGYRNRKGEIDQLLLGPSGLVAVEVKHRNATVHCDRDRWWFVKYDCYGNAVQKDWLQDRGGRSPSEQLNAPAAALEGFLESRGQRVRIERVLIFTHERSRLGMIDRPTVHVATNPAAVLDIIAGSRVSLSAKRLAQIERLVLRDHRFHERRHRRGRPIRAPRAPQCECTAREPA